MSFQVERARLEQEALRQGLAVLSQLDLTKTRSLLLEYYKLLYDEKRMRFRQDSTVLASLEDKMHSIEQMLLAIDTALVDTR